MSTDVIADKSELKSEHVDSYIKLVKDRKSLNRYQPANDIIQIFTNEWTLEYNLANSMLKDDLLSAMNEAKELAGISIELPEDSSIPFKLMKPFLGSLSKALTAQFLAKTLLDKKNDLREAIENDDQLKYLINAIKFACRQDF